MVLCSLHFLNSGPSPGHRVRFEGCQGTVVKLWGSRQDRQGPTEVLCICSHGGQASWVGTVQLKQSTASILCRLKRGFPKRSCRWRRGFPLLCLAHFLGKRNTDPGGGGSGLDKGHSLVPSAPQRREAECTVSIEASWGRGERPGPPRASLWTNSEECLG